MTRATTFRATAIVGGFLLALLMIMTVSRAAFSDTTANAGNTWDSGTVSLTDNYTRDVLGSMFTETDLVPGASGDACIEIIYEGSVDATVELVDVSRAGSTGLAPALDLTITRYSGTDCGDGASALVYGPDTLVNADSATFGDSWSASNGDSEFYHVEWEFDPLADNTYQGKGAMAAFTWQATS